MGNNLHRIGPSPYFMINICHVNMNMFVGLNEIPSMALQGIKEARCYRQTDTHTCMHGCNDKKQWVLYYLIWQGH